MDKKERQMEMSINDTTICNEMRLTPMKRNLTE
jgi:hypothetical protein